VRYREFTFAIPELPIVFLPRLALTALLYRSTSALGHPETANTPMMSLSVVLVLLGELTGLQ
jgi:hypothetical protein